MDGKIAEDLLCAPFVCVSVPCVEEMTGLAQGQTEMKCSTLDYVYIYVYLHIISALFALSCIVCPMTTLLFSTVLNFTSIFLKPLNPISVPLKCCMTCKTIIHSLLHTCIQCCSELFAPLVR